MVLHCDELVPGGHLSTVVFDTGRREGALRWCRDLMFNREVLVSFHGELPVKFTLHQALVQAVEPQIVLHIPDDSHIFKVGIDTCSFGKGVIELCAGTGSMGIGPVFLGAHVVASLDKTPLAAHHLELNHHGHVMCADLCDPNNIWQLHQLIKDEQVTILLGFPCQPYSSQGRMQGHRDARASTLQHAIKADFSNRRQSSWSAFVAPPRIWKSGVPSAGFAISLNGNARRSPWIWRTNGP